MDGHGPRLRPDPGREPRIPVLIGRSRKRQPGDRSSSKTWGESTMMRRWLVLCACVGAVSGGLDGPRRDPGRGRDAGDHAEPVSPRLGRDGHPQAVAREARRAHGPGDRLSQGRRLGRRRGARPARIPVGAGRSRAGEGAADPGGEHPDRLDPHPQRPGLLRLSRRPGRAHRRPGLHGLRLRQGRRGDQRGDRPPPAGLDQDRHRRGRRARSPTTTMRPTSTTGG